MCLIRLVSLQRGHGLRKPAQSGSGVGGLCKRGASQGETPHPPRGPVRYKATEGDRLSLYRSSPMPGSSYPGSVDSCSPLRQYLLPLRDLGIFYGAMPDYRAVEEFQNGISTILAERVDTGMAGCNQTFVAACSLVKNGEKVGGPADFRYSVDPQNLVAAAYNEFASLIVRHARFKKCLGCGRYFRPEHGNQDYCEPSCSTRTRKREQRKRKRSPA